MPLLLVIFVCSSVDDTSHSAEGRVGTSLKFYLCLF